jgi:hypothetical protein
VRDELRRKTLRRVDFTGGSTHEFRPRLVRRRGRTLGRAAQALVEALGARQVRPRGAGGID